MKADSEAVTNAAENNDPELVKWLVEQGAKADSEAVLYAVENNNLDLVKALIEDYGAEVDSDALMGAIRSGDLDVVRLLLKKDKKLINAIDANGETPLDVAKEALASRELVEFLENFAKEHPSEEVPHSKISPDMIEMLVEAVKDGKTEVVSKLLDKNKGLVNAKDKHGYTALELAVDFESDNPDLVKVLIDHGAEVSSEALFAAVKSDNPNFKVVEYLVNREPELIDAKDSYDRTVFAVAKNECDQGIIKLLRDKKAEIRFRKVGAFLRDLSDAAGKHDDRLVNKLLNENKNLIAAKDKDGKTLLELAVNTKDENFIKLVVKKGAKNGGTPFLFDAVRLGQLNLVKYLFELDGELINAKNDEYDDAGEWVDDEESVLEAALRNGNGELIQFVVEEGKRNGGEDFFFDAIRFDQVGVVQDMLKEDSSLLDAEDEKHGDMTVLQLAAWRGAIGVVKLLVEDYNVDISSKAFFFRNKSQ